MAAFTAGAARPAAQPRYRVMVVDDSAVIRGFITRALERDPEIGVVASANNGEVAVRRVARGDIDVVILDIEMPVMDGMTALPRILKARPGIKVIMASTLTRKNAAVSLEALAAGAADYVPKPSSMGELHASEDFSRDLIAKIKALAAPKRPAAARTAPPPTAVRRPSTVRPAVLAVGSSTGGPQALFKVFGALGTRITGPIFLTQHMPPTFTGILAEHLARISGAACAEAADGEAVTGGRVYVAPGNFHMLVKPGADGPVVRLATDPPENFCRPAVDPMLRSLVAVYGAKVLAVILTGMGHDGLAGGRAVVEAGGTLIAQDEPSSVVWGMPGAVAGAGLASAILPIDQIAAHILTLLDGRSR